MSLITQEELLEAAGLTQPAALRRALRKAGIPFKELRGRIVTTEQALTETVLGRKIDKKGPNFERLTEGSEDQPRGVLPRRRARRSG